MEHSIDAITGGRLRYVWAPVGIRQSLCLLTCSDAKVPLRGKAKRKIENDEGIDFPMAHLAFTVHLCDSAIDAINKNLEDSRGTAPLAVLSRRHVFFGSNFGCSYTQQFEA